MKVQTKAGEVAADFSNPENVRKGMLFRVPTDPTVYGVAYRDIVAACDGNFGIPDGTGEFLGCHPEIARREDCERFGIPLRCEQHGVADVPIDAGAHGFVRLRGGGAVDLRRDDVPGMCVHVLGAGRHTYRNGAVLVPTDRFIGLDARYARPKDVERMCCGGSEVREEDGALWRTGKRCTLAIGHSGEHEDLVTGARWNARPLKSIDDALTFAGVKLASQVHESKWSLKAADVGIVQMARMGLDISSCPGCGSANGAVCPDSCLDMQRRRAGWEKAHCGARPKPGQKLTSEHGDHRPALGDERCMNHKGCDGHHSAPLGYGQICLQPKLAHYPPLRGPDGTRWTDDAPLVGCARCGAPVIPTAERPANQIIARDEAGSNRCGWLCEACAGLVSRGGNWRFEKGRVVSAPYEAAVAVAPSVGNVVDAASAVSCRGCGALAAPCSQGCPVYRRAKEAPLVALVSAVPEGLDARGWAAAVLACHEARITPNRDTLEWWIRQPREGALPDAVLAYDRAIAPPGPRPQPERRRGGRDVRLVVDDGRDG